MVRPCSEGGRRSSLSSAASSRASRDAIRRELAHGESRSVAAWLGPTKLSKAIFYATITNVAAYLPFLLLTGDVGRFIYSLPVTVACSLVASRLVSMTFIPLLAFYLLRRKTEPEAQEMRARGFGKWYSRLAGFAIDHRWIVLACSSVLLVLGGYFGSALHHQFFPREHFYIAYVEVRLAEDSPLEATAQTAGEVARVVEDVTAKRDRGGEPVLASITSFIGAGGPRFWFSVPPEAPTPNYAQLLLQACPCSIRFSCSISRSSAGRRLISPTPTPAPKPRQ